MQAISTMKESQGSESFLHPHVTAAMLGVTTQTLRDYERKGILSAVRTVGGKRRYLASAVDRIMRPSEPPDYSNQESFIGADTQESVDIKPTLKNLFKEELQ
ncbi:MAG: MerR family DNA-binding transcriptional regulator [Oscillospiraceae bacterium]|nr:MerR family DNA-binding transcriptional regulator [Oscillospiraceae bacterium]